MPSQGGPVQGAHRPKESSRPIDFVKKVGRGRTLSQDLSPDEAREAFSLLLDGGFTPAQMGAFLQALRIKELTGEELLALAEVFHGRTAPAAPLPGEHGLVLNLASDTGRKGGMVSLLAARLLPAFGIGVGIVRSTPVLSGNHRSFDAAIELWPLLEAVLPLSGEAAPIGPARDSAAPSILIEDCSRLVRGLSALDGLRTELGFRSCLHTAEKLVNPWPATPMVLGISHRHYALRMAETMAARGLKGRIVLGNHGTVDLVLHKQTEVFSVEADSNGNGAGNRVGTGIREEAVAPGDLGLAPAPDVYSLAKLPEWRAWLAGPKDNGLWQAVRLQLAFLLWAGGAASGPGAALAAVRARFPTLS